MVDNKKVVNQFQVEIFPLTEEDIERLDPILRQHVRDRETRQILDDEIQKIKTFMRGGKDEYGRTRRYLVAKNSDNSKIFGCMGYSTPDTDMVTHFNTIPPKDIVELLNAFVDSDVYRGGGIGKKLFEAICIYAQKEGKKYLILNSGPRYRASWGFYDKVCDKNNGFIIGKYSTGGDAKTWLKRL